MIKNGAGNILEFYLTKAVRVRGAGVKKRDQRSDPKVLLLNSRFSRTLSPSVLSWGESLAWPPSYLANLASVCLSS